jgi:hypothetical protein
MGIPEGDQSVAVVIHGGMGVLALVSWYVAKKVEVPSAVQDA